LFSPGAVAFSILSLVIGSLSLLSLIVASLFVKLIKKQNIISVFKRTIALSIALSAIGLIFLSKNAAASLTTGFWNVYLPSITGLAITGSIFAVVECRFLKKKKTIKKTNDSILELFSGIKSVVFPALIMILGMILSFLTGGVEGLAVTAISMISFFGAIIALNNYQLAVNNALEISRAEELESNVIKAVSVMDSSKEAIKIIVKIYAVISAVLSSLILFLIYTQEIQGLGSRISFGLENYRVIIGIFLGGLIPYFFYSTTVQAALRAVKKTEKQFNELKSSIEDNHKYEIYVSIISKAVFKEMIIPVILPIAFLVIVGLSLGAEAIGGLLMGSIVVGFFSSVLKTEGNNNLAVSPIVKMLNIIALLIIGFLA
jgi:K(+)-stimulated pyrophosphate-energized sodium pump